MVAFREVRIRIVATPPGEAPLEVREQWVGLELPLMGGEVSAVQIETCGVVTGEIDREETIGYVIDIEDAMLALASKSPSAVAWWRTNAAHLFEAGGTLVFHEYVCRLVEL
ncbi:hypothetical protein [Opitutus sp. ER46]|uniref:hypothetical protein n=1 Tax=Opitutus sp. ER46 TaxID=2161864 RepID=UPI000D31A8A7|nr:hypothetical protein [Opitutus sp. ER46]PTX90952.1 hypothetical protein DB354_20085 [Opitutus sp. ER46]